MVCKVCGKPASARELCATHYRRLRRAEAAGKRADLKAPVIPRSEPGEGAQVAFRIPAEDKAAAERDAKREGVDVSEWFRRAVRERLASRRVTGPRQNEDGERT